MSAATQQAALERALDCAAAHETDCIFSPEVGLSVPAAFVYDWRAGLKMVIAPRITAGEAPTHVAFQDPVTARSHANVVLNSSVKAEYLEGVSRVMRTDTFNDSAAFCVQLLRLAFTEDCWEQID